MHDSKICKLFQTQKYGKKHKMWSVLSLNIWCLLLLRSMFLLMGFSKWCRYCLQILQTTISLKGLYTRVKGLQSRQANSIMKFCNRVIARDQNTWQHRWFLGLVVTNDAAVCEALVKWCSTCCMCLKKGRSYFRALTGILNEVCLPFSFAILKNYYTRSCGAHMFTGYMGLHDAVSGCTTVFVIVYSISYRSGAVQCAQSSM